MASYLTHTMKITPRSSRAPTWSDGDKHGDVLVYFQGERGFRIVNFKFLDRYPDWTHWVSLTDISNEIHFPKKKALRKPLPRATLETRSEQPGSIKKS